MFVSTKIYSKYLLLYIKVVPFIVMGQTKVHIFAKIPGAYFSWSSAPSGWKWKIREILFCKNFNYKNFPRAGCEFGFFLRVQMVTYSLPRQPAAGWKKFGVFLRPHTYFRDSPPQAGKNLDFFLRVQMVTSETARRRRKKIWVFFEATYFFLQAIFSYDSAFGAIHFFRDRHLRDLIFPL